MKTILRIMSMLCLLAVCAAGPVFAGKKFDITYRQNPVVADETSASGELYLYVLNSSGEPAKDVAVWIEGTNNVTFDNRVIHVGDLADGQPRGVLSEFRLPREVVNPESAEEEITWKVEYTNAAGQRVVAEVVGALVR